MIRSILLLAAGVALAAPALSEDVIRLSPTDREAALEAAAARAPINGTPGFGDGRVHGEMGLTVGSNGLRALDGSAIIPLGQDATLALGFSQVTGGRWRGR